MFDRAAYQLESGRMQAYAFPGGYPVYYLTKDGGTLCAECASLPECQQATPDCPDDSQWYLVGAECNWEDPALHCEHCGARIESAYADDEHTAPDDLPNLDAMEPEELHAYCQKGSNPAPLREYAAIKARAIDARKAGRIQTALQWEQTLERLYGQLPEDLKW